MAGLAMLTSAALLVPAGAAQALPDSNISDVDKLTSIIKDAAPTEANSVIPQAEIVDSIVLASEDSAVAIPQNAQDGFQFIDPTADEGNTVSIGLPVDGTHEDAQVTDDGTAVYVDDSGEVDVAVQATASSVRVSTIIHSADAPTTFKYEIEGATPALLPSGGMELLQDVELKLEDGTTVVQNVPSITADAPWAKDANGKDVPTHYEIEGNAVVQVVETSADTAFPVVADPDWFKIGKCAAAWTYVLFTAGFVIGKSVAIVKGIAAGIRLIKQWGGVRNTVKLMVGASTAKEKTAFFARARSVAGASILDLLGITMIRNNC